MQESMLINTIFKSSSHPFGGAGRKSLKTRMEIVVLNNAGKHSSNRCHITTRHKQNLNEKTPAFLLDDEERSMSQSVTMEPIIVMQINFLMC